MSRNNNEELFLYLEQVLDIRRLKSEGITVKELIKIFEGEGRIFSNSIQSLISMRELLD